MGYILTLHNHNIEGEEIIRIAMAGLEASLGKDHPQTLTSALQLSKNLARRDDDESKLDEAEALARGAWEAWARVLGGGHPYTFKAMCHLSYVLLGQNRLDEAATMCRDAFSWAAEDTWD